MASNNIGHAIGLSAVERLDGRRGERAGGGEIVLLLEFLDCFSERLVVDGAPVAGNVKVLAQCRHPIVLHADLQYGDLRRSALSLIDLAGADIGELGLERAITGGLRLVGIERGGDVAGASNGGKNVTRLRNRRAKIYIRAGRATNVRVRRWRDGHK